MAWRMRPYNEGEIELINYLIREGEVRYGETAAQGHLVQEYVQREMVGRGLRIEFKPRKNPILTVARRVTCNGEQPDVIKN